MKDDASEDDVPEKEHDEMEKDDRPGGKGDTTIAEDTMEKEMRRRKTGWRMMRWKRRYRERRRCDGDDATEKEYDGLEKEYDATKEDETEDDPT
ncbi:unnamed protein product [Cochlearia groenlandica]